jgi:peptidoglycan-associated lipoprotein
MMKNQFISLAVVGLLALAGCGGKKAVQPEAGTNVGTSGAAESSGDDSGAAVASGVGADQAADAAGNSQQRVIYFDFDSSEIRPEFVAVVTAHARRLAGNASVRVRLEGHTDERGSREYNVGLGERRSQAVRRALLLQGVTETQLATVSYGEEKPAQGGSTEEVWAKNRRVEIVYLN